jgi:hypothetical protein
MAEVNISVPVEKIVARVVEQIQPAVREQIADYDRVNAVLVESGLSYPTGSRGVEDLVGQRDGNLERAREAEAKLDKIRMLCDQSEVGAYGSYGPLIVPTSAIYMALQGGV